MVRARNPFTGSPATRWVLVFSEGPVGEGPVGVQISIFDSLGEDRNDTFSALALDECLTYL